MEFDISHCLKTRKLKQLNHPCKHCAKSNHKNACKGFVKGNMKLRVSDDLIITPLSSSLTISYLKKLQLSLDDVGVQEISISIAEVKGYLPASFFLHMNIITWSCRKTRNPFVLSYLQVVSVLRASLMTSTVLITALWNLLVKKPKEET